ncbi:serine protease inhibitor 77Ba-like [Hyposmocoma kahamanoa]|uniref:serine protease inhibitor 77Ba-like n=1 Tax=Hyposmocoma kahamanoa TaxID=1477025 RepID=UPI000E6D8BCB|nr:serine protease inhibitor 77Ba-like [Hyposmocoma kahamanoa]
MHLLNIGVIFAIFTKCSCEVDFSDRPRNFSIELIHFTQLETDGHIVISPFGIWTLMIGVALGATGESYKQLSRAFILPRNENELIEGYKKLTETVLNPKTKGVTLTSKNYVFLDDDFVIYPQFKQMVQEEFDATVKVFDFDNPNAAAKKANSYIKKTGGGRMTNVLTSEDFAESRMLITNVISFKGLWNSPFNKSETTVQPFYNEDMEKIGEVNMMYQVAPLPFSNVRDLKAFVLELPYGDDDKYSMLFILPHRNVKLADVYQNFAKISLKDVQQKLEDDIKRMDLEDIQIEIPRFKISTNVALNKPLNNMGVFDIFYPELASFEKVTSEDIFVSAVIHKADIDVTESGTVASALTTVHLADRISTPKFTANRPFLYFVIEKTTTTVIFGGIYSKPTIY